MLGNWGKRDQEKRLVRRTRLRNSWLIWILKCLPMLLVLIGLFFLLTKVELDWRVTADTVRSSNPWWLGAAIFLHYTTFLFRGARWRVLLMNVNDYDGEAYKVPSTLHCGMLILVGWFVNSVTWFRLGDAYRAYVYSGEGKGSFSRTMGSVVADRIVDVVVVFVIMMGALATLYFGGQVRPSPWFVFGGAILLGGVFTMLMTMYLTRHWIIPHLPTSIGGIYNRFHNGTMGSFKQLHIVFILGVLGWLSEIGRLYLVLMALGVPMAIGMILFVPLANGLLSAVPLTPGGLGIVEAGVAGLLSISLVKEQAVAVALLDRSISYLSVIATGGMLFALRHAGIFGRLSKRPS